MNHTVTMVLECGVSDILSAAKVSKDPYVSVTDALLFPIGVHARQADPTKPFAAILLE